MFLSVRVSLPSTPNVPGKYFLRYNILLTSASVSLPPPLGQTKKILQMLFKKTDAKKGSWLKGKAAKIYSFSLPLPPRTLKGEKGVGFSPSWQAAQT